MRYLLISVAVVFIMQSVLVSQTNSNGYLSGYQDTRKPLSPDKEIPRYNPQLLLAQLSDDADVFLSVQRGIAEGNYEEITRHFGKHIYLSIRSIESGYYSANQAQFVLLNFFNTNKPLSFMFTTYGGSGSTPYATGRGSINVKGNREFIQVYVSLTKQKDRWVISQFNIY